MLLLMVIWRKVLMLMVICSQLFLEIKFRALYDCVFKRILILYDRFKRMKFMTWNKNCYDTIIIGGMKKNVTLNCDMTNNVIVNGDMLKIIY